MPSETAVVLDPKAPGARHGGPQHDGGGSHETNRGSGMRVKKRKRTTAPREEGASREDGLAGSDQADHQHTALDSEPQARIKEGASQTQQRAGLGSASNAPRARRQFIYGNYNAYYGYARLAAAPPSPSRSDPASELPTMSPPSPRGAFAAFKLAYTCAVSYPPYTIRNPGTGTPKQTRGFALFARNGSTGATASTLAAMRGSSRLRSRSASVRGACSESTLTRRWSNGPHGLLRPAAARTARARPTYLAGRKPTPFVDESGRQLLRRHPIWQSRPGRTQWRPGLASRERRLARRGRVSGRALA